MREVRHAPPIYRFYNKTKELNAMGKPLRNQTLMHTVIHFIGLHVHKETEKPE
jgi:hypothetical protein